MTRPAARRLLQFVILLAGIAFAAACASNSQNPSAPTVTVPMPPAVTVSTVQVTSAPSSETSFQLTATAASTDGSVQDVTRTAAWLSSDESLATVTSTGEVTVVGTGNVGLSATFQGVVGSVRLNVVRPATFTLRGVVRDVNLQPVEGARVESLSSNDDHAFSDVSGNYILAGLSAGETIIEATKTGYDTWSDEVVLIQDTSLDVSLVAAPSMPSGTSGRR